MKERPDCGSGQTKKGVRGALFPYAGDDSHLVFQFGRQELPVEAGDMGELERLHAALADPFTDREDDYVRRPPDWGKRLEVSCSS